MQSDVWISRFKKTAKQTTNESRNAQSNWKGTCLSTLPTSRGKLQPLWLWTLPIFESFDWLGILSQIYIVSCSKLTHTQVFTVRWLAGMQTKHLCNLVEGECTSMRYIQVHGIERVDCSLLAETIHLFITKIYAHEHLHFIFIVESEGVCFAVARWGHVCRWHTTTRSSLQPFF